MTETRAATLSIEEVPVTDVERIRPGVEIQAVGPLAAKMTDGWLLCGPIIVCCSDVEGTISACPVVIDGKHYVTTQLDVAHPHQQLRVAGSFALSIDDFARMVERLKIVSDIARFEAGTPIGQKP
jgi:hypothetical protein